MRQVTRKVILSLVNWARSWLPKPFRGSKKSGHVHVEWEELPYSFHVDYFGKGPEKADPDTSAKAGSRE